jgi:predicted kinase
MKKAVILVGIPGSGKSTIAKDLESKGFKRFNSDLIRKELYGDEQEQGDFNDVFGTLYHRLEMCCLLEDCDIVIDNTNIRSRDRNQLIEIIEPFEKHIIEVWLIDTPLEVCLERNSKRERVVPEDIIIKFYNRLEDNRTNIVQQATRIIKPEDLFGEV